MATTVGVLCGLVDELKAALCTKRFEDAKRVVAKLSEDDSRFPPAPTKDDADAWVLVSAFAQTRAERLQLEAEQRAMLASHRHANVWG